MMLQIATAYNIGKVLVQSKIGFDAVNGTYIISAYNRRSRARRKGMTVCKQPCLHTFPAWNACRHQAASKNGNCLCPLQLQMLVCMQHAKIGIIHLNGV